jgi:hypothetical protein
MLTYLEPRGPVVLRFSLVGLDPTGVMCLLRNIGLVNQRGGGNSHACWPDSL